jgi:hypothetical protein
MFFCQVINNADTDNELTDLQSAALIVKLVCFVLLIIEIIVFIWEVTTNRQMYKLKQKGFEPPTEGERRSKYSKPMSIVALGAMGIFILILIVGGLVTEGR